MQTCRSGVKFKSMHSAATVLVAFLIVTSSIAQEPPDDRVIPKRGGSDVVDLPDIPYLQSPPLDYAKALALSSLFYEAQRSGELPSDQRVTWRKNSALDDGSDVGIDLSGGYYDGASYIKYGFPMAYATTVLSWGVIRYRRTYEVSGQLEYVLKTIRWATDYFIKCHNDTYVFYGQVSDKDADNQFWGRPEDMNYRRVSYKITKDRPGSDLAGETSAALSAASIVFQLSDPEYSEILRRHSQELYLFATKYRGPYGRSIKLSEQAYGSSGYKDELAWAAAWLYRKTGDSTYLREASQFFKQGKLDDLATEFSWSDKKAGVQVLLAEITKKNIYRKLSRWFCEHSQNKKSKKFKSKSKYTPGGLLYLGSWGPLRYASNSAFLCLIVADLGLNSTINRYFSSSQVDYILGDNPARQSYVIGFGEKYPRHPFHKSSYCPPAPAVCPRFRNQIPNAHTLYGALVGGPSEDDTFRDQRSSENQNSVTVDFNAGFQSALAGLLDLYIFGPQHRPRIDPPGVVTEDIATPPPPTTTSPPKPNQGVNYADILNRTLYFLEAQKSGLIGNSRLPWRSTSGMTDGEDMNLDLTKGFYTGPGHVKFNLPIFYSMTMLAWSLYEYEDAFITSGLYNRAYNLLKWGITYVENCHMISMNRTWIAGQVGDPQQDATVWDIPERMNYTRKTHVLTPETPGSEIAGEMAAALASASIVFSAREPRWSQQLFNRSYFIYTRIATREQGKYTDEIPSAEVEYPSSGYFDELGWAAAWLDERAKHQVLFQQVQAYYDTKMPTDFSYDNKTAGVQLLHSTRKQDFGEISTFCNWLVTSAERRNGLIYLNSKYPAQYAANVAFILLTTYKRNPSHYNARIWRDTAVEQINILLGSRGQSYVVGYGPHSPKQPFHKASSCPGLNQPCGFLYKDVDEPNPQELIGALVGGPSYSGYFTGKRVNVDQNRVSLDGNAAFQASIAAILYLQQTGQLDNFATSFHGNNFPCVFLATVVLLIHVGRLRAPWC